MTATAPTARATCPKCLGGKRFATYLHVADGVCFRCGGSGKVDAAPAQVDAGQAARLADAAAEFRAAMGAKLPALAAFLDAHAATNDAVRVGRDCLARYGHLTPSHLAELRALYATLRNV